MAMNSWDAWQKSFPAPPTEPKPTDRSRPRNLFVERDKDDSRLNDACDEADSPVPKGFRYKKGPSGPKFDSFIANMTRSSAWSAQRDAVKVAKKAYEAKWSRSANLTRPEPLSAYNMYKPRTLELPAPPTLEATAKFNEAMAKLEAATAEYERYVKAAYASLKDPSEDPRHIDPSAEWRARVRQEQIGKLPKTDAEREVFARRMEDLKSLSMSAFDKKWIQPERDARKAARLAAQNQDAPAPAQTPQPDARPAPAVVTPPPAAAPVAAAPTAAVRPTTAAAAAIRPAPAVRDQNRPARVLAPTPAPTRYPYRTTQPAAQPAQTPAPAAKPQMRSRVCDQIDELRAQQAATIGRTNTDALTR